MNKKNQWTAGIAVTIVAILVIGAIAYGVTKRHDDNTFIGEPTPIVTANSTSGTTTPSVTDTASAQPSTPTCISASQAASEEGSSACVTFTVGYTYTSSKCNAYLDQYSDYSSGFSAWIPDGCSLGNTLISEYANKAIDVTGEIISYNGAPEIEVTSASQISLAQ